MKKLKKSNSIDASPNDSNHDQILNEIQSTKNDLLNLLSNKNDAHGLNEIQVILENSLQEVEKCTRLTDSDGAGSASCFSTLETSGINERNTFEKLSNI